MYLLGRRFRSIHNVHETAVHAIELLWDLLPVCLSCQLQFRYDLSDYLIVLVGSAGTKWVTQVKVSK